MLLQYQSLAEPLHTDPIATPAVSGWAAASPGPVRRRGIATALLATSLAFVAPISALEAPSDAQYPDQLTRPAVHASRQQAYAANLDPIAPVVSPERAWAPTFPDRIARRTFRPADQQALAFWAYPLADPGQAAGGDSGVIEPLRVLQYQALAGPVLVPSVEDVTQYGWGPAYPDRFRLRRHHPSLQLACVQNLDPLPNPPSPERAWAPDYPDRIVRGRLLPAWQQALSVSAIEPPAALPIQDLRWAPSFPERVPGKVYPVAARTGVTAALPPAYPVVALAWQGEAPDQLARVVVVAARQQASTRLGEPIPNVPMEDLRWAAAYPDQVDGRAYRVALQQVLAANIDPIAGAAFVPLSWAPAYPEPIRLRLPANRGLVAAPPPMVVVLVDHRMWGAVYPDQLLPARRPVLAPLPELRLDTVTLSNDNTCIELAELDATQAGVRLTVTQSTLVIEEVSTEAGGFEVC